MIGVIVLNPMQTWRISAEISLLARSGYREHSIWTSLIFAAGPSNSLPAVKNRYRYPSPIRRSDHSLVGPPALLSFRRHTADFAVFAKKPFATWEPGGDCDATNNLGKGNRACKREFGLAPSSLWSRLRLAVTHYLSRGLSGQAQVRARQLFWAVTQRPARFLALASIFIAKPRPSSAELCLTPGASGRGSQIFGHRGLAPVACFHCIGGAQRRARAA